MGKIHSLPPHIISRIAAGEVIERPVYAVKELVENAIDAGADVIFIAIEDAGLKKITVIDNGEGMTMEDLKKSFLPHTTSKLTEELIGIQTLGFRGEALSSIASVSDLTIRSRVPGEPAGSEAILKAGRLERCGPAGTPPGTLVHVQNLFSPVPARKKFLKSTRTEFRHIAELISGYALAYPQIRFTLTHNNREYFDLSKGDFALRLQKVMGAGAVSHLLSIQNDQGYVHAEGYVGSPQISTRLASKQFIYVNNRLVQDKLIAHTVKESYGTLLESTAHPVFALFLRMPSDIVDVNVHPRKEQVSFVHRETVLEAVQNAVKRTLDQHNINYISGFAASRAGTTHSFAAGVLRESVEQWGVKDLSSILKTADIYQLHNTYIIIQTPDGLIFIDQHAAHERILFEQYMHAFEEKKSESSSLELKKPLLMELSVSDVEVVEEYTDVFRKFGFEIERFHDALKVSKVPRIFADRDISQFISEIAEALKEDRKLSTDSISHKMIAYLSCRGAVMAGDKLTTNEAKRIITQLEKTPNNTTCPHGRPTKVEVPITEINRMFKR